MPPLFNYKQIISELPILINSSIRRNLPADVVARIRQLPDLYKDVNDLAKQRDAIQHQRNQITDKIKTASKDSPDFKDLIQKANELKPQFQQLDSQLKQLRADLYSTADSIPNLIHECVNDTEPIIKETVNPQNYIDPAPDRDHVKIATELGLIDIESASKVSGTSWYYLTGYGVLLEQALINYALAKAVKNGFQLMAPPTAVRPHVAAACGFRPRDQNNEKQIYTLADEDLCLIGTAEIPMAGWAIDRVLTGLPVLKAGISRCYRAEAGARGRDTKGLYRVHEFSKVELFAWCETADQAENTLEMIRSFQKSVVKELGLCAQVLDMPANDLGASAYRKYDIEAWMPGRGDYGEVTSTSNCLTYQSQRLNTQFKDKDGNLQYAYTLNGTAMAVPRIMVAIIENFYDPRSHSIVIPEVLRPYLSNQERITKLT
ncbi:hypothetical protein CANCADRAFT_103861 [Tortispora caseinolytica NRRL Y-17796]|uniref:serine--tRNA ligase n=1 Tax=Tortispora caseinolytica NRRL Y-17796 TaxID=767744 RepID=A0A1E4TEM7_9ASCO|nr:hypothetical protein CANCADRAFT_103861 [Tortispora caseinolytica NRRL Y-17796]